MAVDLTPEERDILRANCKNERAFESVLQMLMAHNPASQALLETTELLRAESVERQRAEDALKYSEANLRAILDNTPLSFVLISLDYKIITANRLAQQYVEDVFGKSIVPDMSIHDIVLERDIERFEIFFSKAVNGQRVITEQVFTENDGNTRYFQFIYQPVVTDNGQLFGVCMIAEDITSRKQAEIALRESEAQLKSVTSNYPNGTILMFDHDLRFILVDGVQLENISVERERMAGKTIYDIFDDDMIAVIEPLYRQALAGEDVSIEVSYHESNYLSRSVPIRNNKGQVIAGLTITQDITQRKLSEQHKIDLKLEQERTRILTDFIRDASHEFRTPLATIKSGLHLITKPSLTKHQQEHIKVMEEQVERIVKLVDTLVKMSHLDDVGALKLMPIDLNDAIALAADALKHNYPTHLECQLDDNIPYIQGNLDELIRAVKNVLDNALRHTAEDGRVTVRSYCHDKQVILEVTDTGIGIDAEHLPHIFKRFFRVDDAHTTAGLGLGLSMTRKIIERHDGTITVESAYGRGTVVCIKLPILSQ